MESLKSSFRIVRIVLPNSLMIHEKEEQMETTTKSIGHWIFFVATSITSEVTQIALKSVLLDIQLSSTEHDVFNPLLCVWLLNSGRPKGAANRPGIAGLQLRTRRPRWLTRTKFVPSAGNVTPFSRQFCPKKCTVLWLLSKIIYGRNNCNQSLQPATD